MGLAINYIHHKYKNSCEELTLLIVTQISSWKKATEYRHKSSHIFTQPNPEHDPSVKKDTLPQDCCILKETMH